MSTRDKTEVTREDCYNLLVKNKTKTLNSVGLYYAGNLYFFFKEIPIFSFRVPSAQVDHNIIVKWAVSEIFNTIKEAGFAVIPKELYYGVDLVSNTNSEKRKEEWIRRIRAAKQTVLGQVRKLA